MAACHRHARSAAGNRLVRSLHRKHLAPLVLIATLSSANCSGQCGVHGVRSRIQHLGHRFDFVYGLSGANLLPLCSAACSSFS
jgi:hypothetical protein